MWLVKREGPLSFQLPGSLTRPVNQVVMQLAESEDDEGGMVVGDEEGGVGSPVRVFVGVHDGRAFAWLFGRCSTLFARGPVVARTLRMRAG
jgi:hypothetical protein